MTRISGACLGAWIGCLALAGSVFSTRLGAAPDTPPVQKTAAFTATLTHFQTSSSTVKVVTATIRFQNITTKPLVLAYVHDSGVVADDQGNRYLVGRDVFSRGMGEIIGPKISPDFVLQPGEGADAMLELYWRPGRNDVWGTRYALDLTVRQVIPLNSKQYKLGPESPLEFSGLTAGTWESAAALTPAAPTPASPALTGAHINNEGPFSAQVVGLRTSKSNSGNNPKHVLTATVLFKNISAAPIILAYEAASGLFIDNLGNRYDRDAETGHTATGIGTTSRAGADPQFALAPGETGKAQFQLWRYVNRATSEIGGHDTLYFAVQQLEILPSQQIRDVRQYSLTFPDLTQDNGLGALTDGSAPSAKPDVKAGLLSDLLNSLRRKKK